MYLVDFIYDNIQLSTLGCMVGSAVSGNNDAIAMGSVLTLETIINKGSSRSEIVNADYQDMYTVTFDIIKKPCSSDISFTDKEVTWFMRWLNRKNYCKFIPLYDDDASFYKLFLMGTFTEIQSINIGGQVIGFSLTFTSNSPFGYLDYNPNTFTISEDNGSFIILNESEEIGYLYPESFVITCTNAGNLIITNSLETGRQTEIQDCSAGEIITMDCVHKVITTSLATHTTLYNDFNYIFPRLYNDFNDNINKFTVSLASTITIKYNPIRKVGVIA